MAEIDRVPIFRRLLSFMMKLVPSNSKVVDLACGHCKFLEVAEEMGCRVLGTDARIERVPASVRERCFQIGLVQEVDLEPFDIVLCLGILYHLSLPDVLAMVDKFNGKHVIVDTCRGTEKNKVTMVHEGRVYSGRKYEEGTGRSCAFGLDYSFWPVEEDLVEILSKNHDVLRFSPDYCPTRTYYLLIPRG